MRGVARVAVFIVAAFTLLATLWELHSSPLARRRSPAKTPSLVDVERRMTSEMRSETKRLKQNAEAHEAAPTPTAAPTTPTAAPATPTTPAAPAPPLNPCGHAATVETGGSWVPSSRRPHVFEKCPFVNANSTSWQCSNPEYQKWAWKPEGCPPREWKANRWLASAAAAGGRLALIGGEVMQDLFNTILCEIFFEGYSIKQEAIPGLNGTQLVVRGLGLKEAVYLRFYYERFYVEHTHDVSGGYIISPENLVRSLEPAIQAADLAFLMEPGAWFSTYKLGRPAEQLISYEELTRLHGQVIATIARELQHHHHLVHVPHPAAHYYTNDAKPMLINHFTRDEWADYGPLLRKSYEGPTYDLAAHSAFVNRPITGPDDRPLPLSTVDDDKQRWFFHENSKAFEDFQAHNFTTLQTFQMSKTRPDAHPCAAAHARATEATNDCMQYCVGGLYTMMAVEMQVLMEESFS